MLYEAIPIEGYISLEKVPLFTRCVYGIVYPLQGEEEGGMTRLIYNDTRIHGSTLYKRICIAWHRASSFLSPSSNCPRS